MKKEITSKFLPYRETFITENAEAKIDFKINLEDYKIFWFATSFD